MEDQLSLNARTAAVMELRRIIEAMLDFKPSDAETADIIGDWALALLIVRKELER